MNQFGYNQQTPGYMINPVQNQIYMGGANMQWGQQDIYGG